MVKRTAESASLDDSDLRALEGLGYVGGADFRRWTPTRTSSGAILRTWWAFFAA